MTEINIPPIRLPEYSKEKVSEKVIFKVQYYVPAFDNYVIKPENDQRLKVFVETFRKENPHLKIETIEYWGDGDDQEYYHYVDIYYTTYPWYDEIMSKNLKIIIDNKEYYIWWFVPKGMRIMDVETKNTYFFNSLTCEVTPW